MTTTDDNFAMAVKELRGPATSASKDPEPKEPKPRKPKQSKAKKKIASASKPAATPISQLVAAAPQEDLPAEIDEVDEIDEKQLKTLQESLSGLSKKAIRKLKKLLDSDNNRVQMQTALGVLRATVQALTRDTPLQGAGAEINLPATSQVKVVKGHHSTISPPAVAPG